MLALVFGAMAFSLPAHAQWSASFNLGYLFDGYTNQPQMLFKKSLGDGSAALRFSLGGENNTQSNNLMFYKESKYTNINDWPTKVDDQFSYQYSSKYLVVAPGIELRKNINENNMMYYGLDVLFSTNDYSNEQISYYNSFDNNTELYTIQQIYQYNSESNGTSIMPRIFLGMTRNLGHNFSLMAETAISANMNKSSSTSTNVSWYWDGSDFVNNAPADEYEENPEPWDMNINWLPSFDIYLTYTFNKAN